jgi:1,4-dihydroxy-2-naphthoate octaprenyltransferase
LNSFASYCNRTLSVGVLNLNNMRDEASDRKVGKNTLVVKIGGKKAKLYHYF